MRNGRRGKAPVAGWGHLGEAGPGAAQVGSGAEDDDVQVGARQRQPRGLAPEQRRPAAGPHGACRALDAPHRLRQQLHLSLRGPGILR